MEIVPILSTIILVGTVATFILAVAAYVLYKMRELKGNAVERQEQPVADPHVLMAVRQPGMMTAGGDSAPAEARMYIAPTGTTPPSGRYRPPPGGRRGTPRPNQPVGSAVRRPCRRG